MEFAYCPCVYALNVIACSSIGAEPMCELLDALLTRIDAQPINII